MLISDLFRAQIVHSLKKKKAWMFSISGLFSAKFLEADFREMFFDSATIVMVCLNPAIAFGAKLSISGRFSRNGSVVRANFAAVSFRWIETSRMLCKWPAT